MKNPNMMKLKSFTIIALMFSTFATPSFAELTEDEQEILKQGEISDGKHFGGGIVGTFIGLGIGHAIQDRYMNKGLIMTVGELTGAGMMMSGVVDCLTTAISTLTPECKRSTTFDIGLAVYIGFRVWEIIDIWVAPPFHNKKVKELREKSAPSSPKVGLFPIPSPNAKTIDGFGVRLSFSL